MARRSSTASLPGKARFAAELAAGPETGGKADPEQPGQWHRVPIQDAALAIDQGRVGCAVLVQHDRIAGPTEDGQGGGAVTEGGDHDVGAVQDRQRLAVAPLQVVQMQARLRRAAADAARLHDQFARVQAEAGEAEHAAADRADVVRAELGIALGQGLGSRGIGDAQRAAMQDGDRAWLEGDPCHSVEQGVGDGGGAGGAAHDCHARVGEPGQTRPQPGQAAGRENLARLQQFAARPDRQVRAGQAFGQQAGFRLAGPGGADHVAGGDDPLAAVAVLDGGAPSTILALQADGAMARQHGAGGMGGDDGAKRLAYQGQETTGACEGNRPVACLGDGGAQRVGPECGERGRARRGQAIGEGGAGAVGIDFVLAERAAAKLVRLLDHHHTLVEQGVEQPRPMRGQQWRQARGAAADNGEAEAPAISGKCVLDQILDTLPMTQCDNFGSSAGIKLVEMISFAAGRFTFSSSKRFEPLGLRPDGDRRSTRRVAALVAAQRSAAQHWAGSRRVQDEADRSSGRGAGPAAAAGWGFRLRSQCRPATPDCGSAGGAFHERRRRGAGAG